MSLKIKFQLLFTILNFKFALKMFFVHIFFSSMLIFYLLVSFKFFLYKLILDQSYCTDFHILYHDYNLIFCFRPHRRKPFLKTLLIQLIIDHCKYILSDSHFVNSIELKEKYTYIHTYRVTMILIADIVIAFQSLCKR